MNVRQHTFKDNEDFRGSCREKRENYGDTLSPAIKWHRTIKEHFKYVQFSVQHHKDSNCDLYVPQDFRTCKCMHQQFAEIVRNKHFLNRHLESQFLQTSLTLIAQL
uniref:Uncharacterized protein n=1 Tax=Glossina austeni TaxID=7395 RepID=A0A1A9V2G2_GLOAU